MSKFDRYVRYFVYFSALALFLTLFLPVLQEEGTYPLRAMNMIFAHDYLNTTRLGVFYPRPPLIPWLIMGISHIIGWTHSLLASRLLNATACVLTAYLLFRLTKALTAKEQPAYLSVAVYFSWALLIKLGWLAYADTMMSLGVMISILGLWLGVEHKQNRYLILAGFGVIFGFMSKALVPYGMYGIMGLSLLFFHPNRTFLLKPFSIVIGLATFSYLFLWGSMASPHYLPMMWHTLVHGENDHHFNLLRNLASVTSYLYQIFWLQPSQFALAIFPMGIVALICGFKNYSRLIKGFSKKDLTNMKIALVAFLILLIPCWFSWRQWPETRYYLPGLPLFAIFCSYILEHLTEFQKRLSIKLLGLMVILKLLTVIGFYIFYNEFRLNYVKVGHDIVAQSQGLPIYILRNPLCHVNLSVYYGIDLYLLPNRQVPYSTKIASGPHYSACISDKGLKPPLSTGDKLVKTYVNPHQDEIVYLIKSSH